MKVPSKATAGLAAWLLLLAPAALVIAQDAKKAAPAAGGVFDDEPASKAKDKDKSKEKERPDSKSKDAKKSDVTDRDTIGFTQQNVAAQMTELEERMFRLSEALRSLEPENASRLRLALNFSREELILQQMKEAQKLLTEAQLANAETEARELLAKLEHLRQILLAEDLDFQMKLARLRQMREAMGQLERIIKEERRELAWSRKAIDRQAELVLLRDRKAELQKLVKAQESVVADTKADPKSKGLRDREEAVRKKAADLAADPTFAKLDPPHLGQADPHLGDALTNLDRGDGGEAVAAESRALDLFKKELDRLNDRIGETEKAVAAEEFRKFERDQAKNRGAADNLATVSARLGGSGVALQKDLIRSSGSMRDAEGDLDKSQAKPAANDQLEALKHLTKGQQGLGKAVESLLTELRAELQTRIIAELTEMHELQQAIRESTEAQVPAVRRKSRTALVLLAGLSQKESELAERTERLQALVEETEFGVALPTAMKVLGREMRQVQGKLKDGDASKPTILLEKRIEDDLLALLEAMRRLPPTTPPPPGAPLPTDPNARERELNRLIAELKMIRLLQVRLNDDTTGVDKDRPGAAALPPEIRREIEALEKGQEEIRDSLSKVANRFEGPEDDEPPAKVDE
ncbi:MAG TPA: DUF4175 domain-containing protein [Isosphaeraceae bacterium]|jgi:hypothetical protein|nr:DUF4175 domain-containing protein [Isosphaeraceae bacterium]